MKHTERLAAWMVGLRFDHLGLRERELAQSAVRDAVGVALFGRDLEWSRIVRGLALELGGAGGSTLWGEGVGTTAAYAALANGTAVHSIEMDDRHHNLQLHNGAATIPAAFAVAEAEGSTGAELLVAVVCGYEAAYRVARATKGAIEKFYWVSIRNIFGATAASAKLLRLDVQKTQWALGIAGSMASGLWEVKNDPERTMIKRLQGGGWPSHAGVLAALYAREGLTAPSGILEGTDGLRSFCTAKDLDEDKLSAGLGTELEILNWETKPYAAWGNSHSAIDGVYELMHSRDLRPEDVAEINLGVTESAFWHSRPHRPESIMAAQSSLPFIVAAAMYRDLRDPAVWAEEIIADERIESLRRRVNVSPDDELTQLSLATGSYPGSKVLIRTSSGDKHVAWVRHALGSPGNPLTAKQVSEKFALLTKGMPRDDFAHLDRSLGRLAELSTVTDVWRPRAASEQ